MEDPRRGGPEGEGNPRHDWGLLTFTKEREEFFNGE